MSKIKHKLKLLSVMTDDESYEEILELPPSKRKGEPYARSSAS